MYPDQLDYGGPLIGVGFEPTPPKRLVPETSALDRSAIQPMPRQTDPTWPKNGHFRGDLRGGQKWPIRPKESPCYSPSGTRTRVAWVKTMYPDQLD